MSDPLRITMVGATGLVGSEVIAVAVGRDNVRLNAVTRREIDYPPGARMEAVLANPKEWGEVIAATAPQVFLCALGTTWAKSGKSEAAFRAVDQTLVLDTARAAKAAGASRAVLVSSTGADRTSKNFYLRVKGEVERDMAAIGFDRLDILRPGLLTGPRGGDRRVKERLAILASPVTDLLLHGKYRRYRSPRLAPNRIVLAGELPARGFAGQSQHRFGNRPRGDRRFRRK